jgi:hypothetical protein
MNTSTSQNFTKKTSGVFASILIGLIILSFAITSFHSGTESKDDVAKVGKYSIKIRHYEQQYQKMISAYQPRISSFPVNRRLASQNTLYPMVIFANIFLMYDFSYAFS